MSFSTQNKISLQFEDDFFEEMKREHDESGRASVRASIAGVDLLRAKSTDTNGAESPSKRKLSYNDAVK